MQRMQRWISGLAALVLSGSMAMAVDGGRVWVAPFSEANDSGAAQTQNPDWISRGFCFQRLCQARAAMIFGGRQGLLF